jgi:Kdo2-lipid IVA lauroyltransferase/acyltransferase
LEDLAIAAISSFLRILPEVVALGSARVIGWLAGSVFGLRRAVIRKNLALAFPRRPEAWRRRVARRVFPHIAREVVMLLRAGANPTSRVGGRIHFDGLDVIDEALEEGKGVILLTGHLGNWEIAGGALALQGYPLDAVVQRIKNPLVDRRIRGLREGFGVGVIYRKDAPRAVLRSLRRGRIVALAADQNVRRGGLFVDYFGVPASTARGPALFALRTGAPVVVGTSERLPGWRARYRVRFVRLGAADAIPFSEEALMRGYFEVLELAIREAPEQYFWPHDRWKSRPPDENAGREPGFSQPV